jgi:hypothetical protein
MKKAAVAALIAAGLLAPSALPQIVRGQIESPRLPQERDTDQLGGVVAGRNILNVRSNPMGVLRCRAGDAFVGLRMARGSAIDYLRVQCAPVRCANGPCTWSQPYWGPEKGNPNGGAGLVASVVTIDQTCPPNSAVTGFRGATTMRGAYAADIELECKRLGSRPPAPYVNGVTVATVTGEALPAQRRDPVTARPIALRDPSLEVSCKNTAATALSYAMGKFGLGIPVLQAVSLYCVDGSSSCPLADPELPPLVDRLKSDANTLRTIGEVAGDHFFFGVSETLTGILDYLKTPCENNAGALSQSAGHLLNFFTLPDAQRNQVLSQGAGDAVNLFRTDPARFLGQQAPNAVPVERGVQLAKTAGANLRALNAIQQRFGNFANVLRGTRFNPARCTTNCFWASLAYDQTRATWRLEWAAASPPVHGRTITDTLRNAFGNRQLDPHHGPLGTLALRLGIPMPSSRAQIEQALMTAADPRARGLVFVRESGQMGHVFNAFKHEGQVYFYDAQIGAYANPMHFPAGADVFFYRTN